MRRFIKYLLPALLLALCLSLAACGSGGDTDTDTDAAPDSFEGMVKDGERMVSLSDYGGTWRATTAARCSLRPAATATRCALHSTMPATR